MSQEGRILSCYPCAGHLLGGLKLGYGWRIDDVRRKKLFFDELSIAMLNYQRVSILIQP